MKQFLTISFSGQDIRADTLLNRKSTFPTCLLRNLNTFLEKLHKMPIKIQ